MFLRIFGFLTVSFLLFSTALNAAEKLQVLTGVPPVAYLVSRIGQQEIRAISLLPEGRSPHEYEPGPKDIRAAAVSRLFFTTGMRFEQKVGTLIRRNGRGKVVDLTGSLHRIPFAEADGHHHHGSDHKHADNEYDPHVWLSIDNDVVMAQIICRELCLLRPEQKAFFEKNTAKLIDEFRQLKSEISNRLKPYRNRSFFVYHPAFGYFSEMTGLHQEAVELGGREASPARLAEVIREAKADQVKVIFVQPQFNPASMRALARAIYGSVAELDPLAADVIANMRKMTDAIVRGFTTK